MTNGTGTAAEPVARRTVTAASRSRSAVSNDPVRHVDGNTRQGRRVRDIYRALMARIGNPDDVLAQASALRVAELRAIVEDIRVRLLLAGEAYDADLADTVVRLEGAADRAERRLKVSPKRAVTLAEHVAQRAKAGG